MGGGLRENKQNPLPPRPQATVRYINKRRLQKVIRSLLLLHNIQDQVLGTYTLAFLTLAHHLDS